MLNFCLYKSCAMCLSLLHFQPCAGSEPDCNCCLSNKYTYMQLRSPEVTRVNFHLSGIVECCFIRLHGSIAIKVTASLFQSGAFLGTLGAPSKTLNMGPLTLNLDP